LVLRDALVRSAVYKSSYLLTRGKRKRKTEMEPAWKTVIKTEAEVAGF